MMAWEKNIFLKKAYPSKMHLESLSTVGIYQYNKVFCDKKKQKATKKTQKGGEVRGPLVAYQYLI